MEPAVRVHSFLEELSEGPSSNVVAEGNSALEEATGKEDEGRRGWARRRAVGSGLDGRERGSLADRGTKRGVRLPFAEANLWEGVRLRSGKRIRPFQTLG